MSRGPTRERLHPRDRARFATKAILRKIWQLSIETLIQFGDIDIAWNPFSSYDIAMGRFAFAILLIANLLVCPFRCYSCQTGVVSGDDCAEATCSCCHYQDQNDDESSSDEPSHGGDCSCPNCICEGATVEADRKIPSSGDCVAPWAWIAATDDQLRGETYFSRIVARNRRPCYRGGRDALVAYQSWLI